MTEREFAIQVVRRLRDAGFQALWAGGCVRDEVLGRVPKDYDVATDATPDQVGRLFRRTIAVGAAFGVIEVLGPRTDAGPLKVQVATFRSDGTYTDGRHPDQVRFGSPTEDALRRDFTINGMFFDPLEDRLIDLVGGHDDLQNRILRAIGEPAARFAEDKLRMLRAVRFATVFELTLDPATESAIHAAATDIRQISAERVAEELRRLLISPHRASGVRLLMDTGLAAAILPELLEMKGLPQGFPDAPTSDLWDHVIRVLDLLGPDVSFPLALAALLHDVGKRRTVGRTPERYTFYGHEHVSRRMAADICQRLKLSTAERERVEWLVEKHQFLCDAPRMRLSTLKTILAHEGIRELLALHRADALATGRPTDHVAHCEHLLAEWSQTDLNPSPLIGGHDLAREFGLTPGPIFKQLLDSVRVAQLDGTIHSSSEALDLVKELLAARDPPGADPG
jgi:poly(A) polymerase